MATKPNLRVVSSRLSPQPTPEAELARLFAEERRLREELRKVDNSLRFERNRYRAKHALLMLPGFDSLRRQFGGEP